MSNLLKRIVVSQVPNVLIEDLSIILRGKGDSINLLEPDVKGRPKRTLEQISHSTSLDRLVKAGKLKLYDENGTELTGTDALKATEVATLHDITSSGGAVASVNGEIGVVSLSTADIPENTNLYYTDSRVTNLINNTSINDLSDVDTTGFSLSINDILQWNGNVWKPSTLSEAALTSFVDLIDTPNTYIDKGNFLLRVKSTIDGIEFIDGSLFYASASHSHSISDVTGITATTDEINLLDLTGLTSGYVLRASDATTASWSQLKTSDLNNDSSFISNISTFTTSDLTEGINLYYTDERVDDRVSSLIQNGTGISWVYDDGYNTLTPTMSLSTFSLTDMGTANHSDLTLDDGTNPHNTTKSDVELGDVENTALSTWAGSSNITTVGNLISLSTQNGIDIDIVDDPSSLSGSVSSGGNIDDGNHYYSVTFITEIGETHSYYSKNIVTGNGNNTVTLTIPISLDNRVIGRRIYRTKANDSSYHEYFLIDINNNIDTEYVDIASDSTLSGDIGLSYFRANTTSNYITVKNTKVIITDEKLTLIGFGSGVNLTSGGRNTFFGSYSAYNLTSGNDNFYAGYKAGYGATSGVNNSGIGSYTMTSIRTGSNNTSFGAYSQYYVNDGSYNTSIGYYSLRGSSGNINNRNTAIGARSFGNISNTGSYNIGLGYNSGYYETGSYKLIIDSIDRGDESTSREKALIYGIMDTFLTNQIICLGGGGRVGINTISPNKELDVYGDANISGDIFASNLNISSWDNHLINVNNPHSVTKEQIGISSTSDLIEGTNLYYTDERVDDRVNALIQDTTKISWTYDDVANTLTPALSLISSDVGLGNVENTALSTWAGSSNITTVGVLTGLSVTKTNTANASVSAATITLTQTPWTLTSKISIGLDVNTSITTNNDGTGSVIYGQRIINSYTTSSVPTVHGLSIGFDFQKWGGSLTTYRGLYLPTTTYSASPATITNYHAIYQEHSVALNYFAGKVGIGVISPSLSLEVSGDVSITDDLTVDTDTLIVDSTTGQVGIGINAPLHKLHVVGDIEFGSGANEKLYSYNSTRSQYGSIQLYNASTGDVTITTTFSAGDINLTSGTSGNVVTNKGLIVGTDLLVTGNVGIGTDSPQTLTHIYGLTPILRLQDTGVGIAEITKDMAGLELISYGINSTTAKYSSAIKFMSTDPQLTTENPKLLAGIFPRGTEAYEADTSGGMAIDFATTPNNAGAINVPLVRMTIDKTGYVGIGKTVPSTLLHLSSADTTLTIDGTTDNAILVLNSGLDSGGEYSSIQFKSASNTKWSIEKNTSDHLNFYDNVGSRAIITAYSNSHLVLMPTSGNVGIGTATPAVSLDNAGEYLGNQYIGFSRTATTPNARAYFGYNSISTNAVIQGISGKGIEFNVNNNTFGSGTAMSIDINGVVTCNDNLSVGGDILVTGGNVSGITYLNLKAGANVSIFAENTEVFACTKTGYNETKQLLRPSTDNTIDCGSSDHRWANLYSNNVIANALKIDGTANRGVWGVSTTATSFGNDNNTYWDMRSGTSYLKISGNYAYTIASTGINPYSTGNINLGTATRPWYNLYLKGSIISNTTLSISATSVSVPSSFYVSGVGSVLDSDAKFIIHGHTVNELLEEVYTNAGAETEVHEDRYQHTFTGSFYGSVWSTLGTIALVQPASASKRRDYYITVKIVIMPNPAATNGAIATLSIHCTTTSDAVTQVSTNIDINHQTSMSPAISFYSSISGNSLVISAGYVTFPYVCKVVSASHVLWSEYSF